MSSRSQMLTTLVVLSLATGLSGLVWAEAPQGVSPGALDRLTNIRGECPTFSWEAVLNASYYELLVYAIGDRLGPSSLSDADLTEVEEAQYARVPGGATSWTPSLEERLVRGGSYVWFIRGVVADEADRVVTTGEWSPGMYFAIAAIPSMEEVQTALEVMHDYLGAEHGDFAAPDRPDGYSLSGRPGPAEVTWGAAATARSVPTAPAAIRGENADSSGESFGVVGTSASVAGAGVGAANAAGGADVVLDGSADGTADTVLRESGVERSWPTNTSFGVSNPGAGSITLAVNGAITGSGSGITGLDADNLATGTLATGRFSAHDDLLAEGYLDDNSGTDLPTRSQADARYVNISGDTMTGTLTVNATGGDDGVNGTSEYGYGVHGYSSNDYAGYFYSATYRGVYSSSASGYFAGYFINRGGSDSAGLRVDGTLYVTGAKTGFVVDIAVNEGEEPLETGDVVVVTGFTDPVAGETPVMRVQRATEAGSTGVVGVVEQEFIVESPVGDTPRPAGEDANAARGTAIAPGQFLSVVTLGAFRLIKADASYGAIRPGDLLVSSPNPGYAMRSDDPQPGSIIGKAMGELETGMGSIPAIVTLQ